MKNRQGFTLIELLVAITIFVVLTLMAVSAFNLNAGSERGSSAARQVQAMLEGAKSRAFKFQRPVGVRFIIDENFPAELSGMMYVQGQSNPAGGSYETGLLRYIDLNGSTSSAEAIQFADVQGNTGIPWNDLKDRGAIQAGVKIRIPAKTGRWFTVSSVGFLTPNDTVMQVTEALDATYAAPFGSNFTNQSKTVTYELDLSSVMGPVPGEDPVSLPRGTVVDLRSSKVPNNWNISRWIEGKQYSTGNWVAGISTNKKLRVYRAENDGFAGSAEPVWPNVVNSTVVGSGAPVITWRCYDKPRFDIIFTPQGTVMGSVVVEGLLHLTIAETRDTREVFDSGDIGLPAWDLRDMNGDGDKPDHIGSFRIITIFPSSGSVNVSPIDQTDGNSDDVADSLFQYAIEGKTAK